MTRDLKFGRLPIGVKARRVNGETGSLFLTGFVFIFSYITERGEHHGTPLPD